MFGMAKMRPGLESYYEKTIAHGADDYYAEAGEAPGVWAGAGASGAGITGEVTAPQLAALFGHGVHPFTGVRLGQRFSDRSISGHSISLSAPKGVSVLWALGGDDIAAQVRSAHDAAVSAALGYLDEHVAFSRIGRGGPLHVDTDGLIAAVYVHRTSRAFDPQLHSHLLVANKVCCPDGRWRALDGDALFNSQKACGAVYRAALRAELTGRLGVAWTPVDAEGLTDLAGVPERLVDMFSTRAREVNEAAQDREDYLEQQKGRPLTKRERAGVRQAAALSTRSAKSLQGLTTHEHAEQSWAAEAATRDISAEAARRAFVDHRTWLATHPTETQHLRDLDNRITDRICHLGEHARGEPPAHVVRLIGPPNGTTSNLTAWQHAAAKIEAYREQWQTPSTELGRQPDLSGTQAGGNASRSPSPTPSRHR